ncbi:cupin domain-containing protein [Tsuneonella sp. HG249]
MPNRLADFDVAKFLCEHWQKKPLLIRNPWTRWSNPLGPDELAGLACEEYVESRLVSQQRRKWKLDPGPFSEERFRQAPRDPWTLLVQSVDHHVPSVAALLDQFRFVPNWRVDDVMVSYAVDGGGVGPHFDHYDVFLVQGLGRRQWQLGGLCDDSTELLPHDDLRLLANFQAAEDWILDPGDILYVPPGFAHRGVAVGDDCMTYSIGFRAPSREELISCWTENLLDELDDDDRYTDPDLEQQGNPGEISASAIARLHAMVTDRLLDRQSFARWFGTYSTRPKGSDVEWEPEEQLSASDARARIEAGDAMIRNPACRYSFIREGSASVSLFVDGRRFPCSGSAAEFAEKVCANARLASYGDLPASALALVIELVNHGSLAFERED